MISTFQTHVTKLEVLSLSLILLELSLEESKEISFNSGQYIAIVLPDGKSVRSYSISSSEFIKDKVQLTVNIYDVSLGGAGVEYIKNLKLGDNVSIKGPFGKLTLVDAKILNDNKLNPDITEIIWIGTGAGIAPIKSMLEYINYLAKNTGDERLQSLKSGLYSGARFDGDICYFEEFKKIQESNNMFRFKYCLSKLGTDENKGNSNIPEEYKIQGYVTDQILKDTNDYHQKSHIHVFACGKVSTIKAILETLTNNGFDKTKFHIENYA